MRESQTTVQQWIIEKKAEGHDFMFLCSDTFDYSQYPVGVKTDEFWEKYEHYNNQNMQRIDAIYDTKTQKEVTEYPYRPVTVKFTVAITPDRIAQSDRITFLIDQKKNKLVEVPPLEREALEQVRQALLNSSISEVAARAVRALEIIDQILGEPT